MTINSNPSNVPSQISATALVKASQGVLGKIFVSAASSTPTITIYDSSTAQTSAGLIVSVFTPVAGSTYTFDAAFANGLYIVISGTVQATVMYV